MAKAILTVFCRYRFVFLYGNRIYPIHLIILSQSFARLAIFGYSKSAPASNNTLSGRGPVLTAIVKMPAATPASTPIGAFSTTNASLARTPAFAIPSDKVRDEVCHILRQKP